MNKVLLTKNKYAIVGFGTTNKHTEQQYRLFVNRIKLKQKKYVNALTMFVNIFNTFITEKFPNEKELWLIVNDNQTTNLDLLDAKDKIYNITEELDKIEERLKLLEANKGVIGAPNYFSMLMKPDIQKGGILASYMTLNNIVPFYDSKQISDLPLCYIPNKIVTFDLDVYNSNILNESKASMRIILSI